MLSGTRSSRGTDFDASTEDVEDGHAGFLLEPHENALQNSTTHPPIMRAVCWTLCSATAIYTSKRLMINHGYHYPLTIAFHSYLSILIVYTFFVYIRTTSSAEHNTRWRRIQTVRPDKLWPNRTWLSMIPAALAAGASLPMFLSGLLHMPSLAVLVMVFPISYGVESLILCLYCSSSRSQKWLPWEVLIILVASSTVLFNEYRLMVPGLIWGVTGVLFVGITRALFTIGSERFGTELARLDSYHGFIVMSLTLGLSMSLISGCFLEHIKMDFPVPISTSILMGINIVAMVGTAFSGTTFLAYSPITFPEKKSCFSNMPISMVDSLTSFAASLIIILISINSKPITVISWVQVVAYMISSISVPGANQMHSMVLIAMDFTQRKATRSPNVPQPPRKWKRVFTYTTLFIFMGLLSWTISGLSILSVRSIPPSILANLDTNYTPKDRFDIVISMYKESPSSVRQLIDSIKSTQFFSTISPNIIIYTKNPDANPNVIRIETGAATVEHLDNVGREGATYLHHIVNKWDKLATQTLFIQAHAHNMRELLPRIDSYLVPTTGMLSLGFTGVLCDCATCGDRWGWTDQFSVIPALYTKIYKKECDPQTPILLSYKGQFVASAKRIRGVDRNVFKVLLDSITGDEGWLHDPRVIGDVTDTPDNPFFGFTMERIWGLLMQCATDGGVAAKCPSLLSGKGRAGEVGDCQCLDA